MNDCMFAFLGWAEVFVILHVLLVMAGIAATAAVLLVWLLRRHEGKPADNPPARQSVQPPPESASTCPRCGTPLPADSPQGLCPRCVMGVGLATQTEATGEFGPHGTKVTMPPPSPADIAKHFPQLEILECLGRGGMGVVYKARQPKLNRIVALKILAPEKGADPKFAERFEREAQALARLSHPNIVTVHDFGEADGLYYLTMEFVDGVSLRQLLQTRKIAPEEALAIVPKICEALQFAHEQGVVHRDIKPENVLLDKQGRVKIADFGIAKIVEGSDALPRRPSDAERTAGPAVPTNLTQDQVLGTPHYMAPEQVEHPQTVDHRADIYSLGVVFYEMLTGELPLGKFQPPSKKVQVDVRLDEIVLRALEKEPGLRYQQASVLKTEVETIASTPESSRSGRKSAPSEDHPDKSETTAATVRWATATRWCARILGTLWGLLILVFVVGEGSPPIGEQPVVVQFEFTAMAFMLAGCVAGWWRDLPAALLTLVGWILFHVAERRVPGFSLFHVPLLSGLLFAVSWVARRGALTRFVAHRAANKSAPAAVTSDLRLSNPVVLLFLVIPTLGLLIAQLQVFREARERVGRQQASSLPTASAETWSPKLAPGEKMDLQKILGEAKELMEKGRYEEALQRHLWYHHHALEYDQGQTGVRLSFALSAWVELGRRYPKAKQALIEIRDRDTRALAEGKGYANMFADVRSINRELQDEDATYALFKTIREKDPQLAGQCYFWIENLLVAKGEYQWCYDHMGDPQTRYDRIRQGFDRERDSQQRMAKIRQTTAKQLAEDNRKRGVTNGPAFSPPDTSAMIKKSAEDRFVGQVRQLIEILVATGRKAEAEKIRDQAVAVLNVPKLQSAVSDAEEKLRPKLVQHTWANWNNGQSLGSFYAVAGTATETVAVGIDGRIATRNNAAGLWTIQTFPGDPDFRAIVFANRQYVVVREGGSIMTSPDGISWTPSPSPTTNNLLGLFWDGHQYLAGGDRGTILASRDGITWTSRDSGSSINFYSFSYSGSRYVAVGNDGIRISTDSVTWATPATRWATAEIPFTACTWTGTEFLACGLGLDDFSTIYTCPDGNSWKPRDATVTNSLRAAISINGVIFVAGDNVIKKSTDGGTTWQDTFASDHNNLFMGLAFNGQALIAVGFNHNVWATPISLAPK